MQVYFTDLYSGQQTKLLESCVDSVSALFGAVCRQSNIQDDYASKFRLLLKHTGREVTQNDISTQGLMFLCLVPRLRGGKGGFGSMLRAQGGRMSAAAGRRQANYDSCRDLNGRRIRDVKEAQSLIKSVLEAQRKKRQEVQKQMKKSKSEPKNGAEGKEKQISVTASTDSFDKENKKFRNSVAKALNRSLRLKQQQQQQQREQHQVATTLSPGVGEPIQSSLAKERAREPELTFWSEEEEEEEKEEVEE